MFAVVKARKAYNLVKGSDNLLEGENGKELYLRFTRPSGNRAHYFNKCATL